MYDKIDILILYKENNVNIVDIYINTGILIPIEY